jgi:hypothetical protein
MASPPFIDVRHSIEDQPSIGVSTDKGLIPSFLEFGKASAVKFPEKKTANDGPTLNLISPSFAVSARKVGRLVDV